MPDPDVEKTLRRKLYHAKLHKRYLETLATDPASANAEIQRHLQEIAKLHDAIRLHKDRIESLENQRDDAPYLITQVEARIRSLKQSQRQLLIEKYLEEYREINKRIGAYDVSAVATD